MTPSLNRPLPALVPLTDPEYHAFLAAAHPTNAADKVASGEWTPDESLDLAKKSFESLLTQGRETQDN